LAAIIAAGLLTALPIGCGPKFTRVDYETVFVGQQQWEVQQALGTPHASIGNTWIYENDMPFYKAVIWFEDGRVTRKAWSDVRGELDGNGGDD
jgi:hypothetical protein